MTGPLHECQLFSFRPSVWIAQLWFQTKILHDNRTLFNFRKIKLKHFSIDILLTIELLMNYVYVKHAEATVTNQNSGNNHSGSCVYEVNRLPETYKYTWSLLWSTYHCLSMCLSFISSNLHIETRSHEINFISRLHVK